MKLRSEIGYGKLTSNIENEIWKMKLKIENENYKWKLEVENWN